MSAKKTTQKARKDEKVETFSAVEKAAMKERANEQKAAARWAKNKAAGASDLLAKVAEMEEPDRAMATRIHEIVTATAPELMPRTWYGMPAYAKEGKVICFFQSGQKFKTRYATLGFQHDANLDDGAMWPVAFALEALTPDTEARIVALVAKAAS